MCLNLIFQCSEENKHRPYGIVMEIAPRPLAVGQGFYFGRSFMRIFLAATSEGAESRNNTAFNSRYWDGVIADATVSVAEAFK